MTEPAQTHLLDVALNIFAKPFQVSLSVLSLLRQSGSHINKIWLNYEPQGSKFDQIPPYCIYEYVVEKQLIDCEASQPASWLARGTVDLERIADPAYRHSIRYQYAWENSKADLLFIAHNDVYILRDIIGAMKAQIGDAFAIGQLGQCWNCPASYAELTNEVMERAPCTPETYLDFKPTHAELKGLYAKAAEKGIFTRPYARDGFEGEYKERPWPLPECRVNEWAILINLKKTRSLCIPDGKIFPIGGFASLAGHNLDTGVEWFRALNLAGLTAKHFDIAPYMKHWVGTGNKTPVRYAHNEENALHILAKHFPDYVEWLKARYKVELPV